MKENFVNVLGKKVFYVESGSGPTVLYIHGNTASHIWWEEVMDLPGYRTIAMDMVNFGASEHIDDYSPATYGKYVYEFMNEVGIDTAIVVGHSLGGAVAFDLAFHHPEKVDKLMLLDGCPIDGLQTPEAYHPVIKQYLVDRNLFSQALAGIMGTKATDSELVNRFVDEAYKMNPDSYIGHAVSLGEVNYIEDAKKYTKPALFVVGSLDPLISEEHAKTAMSYLNGEYKVVENYGHCLNVENPELFKSILLDFIND